MFENLREAARAAATERTWSQAVQLARDQRVIGRARSGDAIALEVRLPSRPTPFEVILNPAHGEWECDCPSREAVCSHVVAAVIASIATRNLKAVAEVGDHQGTLDTLWGAS